MSLEKIHLIELFQDLSESHGKSGGANIQLHASRGLSLQCCEGMQMSRWHVTLTLLHFFCPTPVFAGFFLFCNVKRKC